MLSLPRCGQAKMNGVMKEQSPHAVVRNFEESTRKHDYTVLHIEYPTFEYFGRFREQSH